jgi:hypothetical protein
MNKNLILTLTLVLALFSLAAAAQRNPKTKTPGNQDVQGAIRPLNKLNGTFGVFTEISPADSLFITPPDVDFWVISTAPGDYDNDGDLDIAVLGYYVVYNLSVDYKLILMSNEGPGGTDLWNFTYIDVPVGALTTGASDMAWGDADGDGDLDLVVGTDGNTVIYRNDSGTLVLTDTVLPGYWEDNSQAEFDLRSITWADYDNDGDLDLLVPSVWDDNTNSYLTSLMRNDGPDGAGGWIFSANDTAFAPTVHAESSWADCDGDGDLDLLLANIDPVMGTSFIRLYRNNGNGTFTGEDILGTLGVEHGQAQWGDYDGDGDLDILVAGGLREVDSTYTSMALRIYRNDTNVYMPLEVIADPASEGWFDLTAATWADYDSDGDMDILLAGNYNSGTEIEGRARIYTNTNGTFTDSGTELPSPRAWGDRGGTFSWEDIDGDGDLDYFVAGQYFVPGGNGLVEAQMHLYRNDTPGQNSAPVTPTGLSFTQVSDNSALVSWLPGSDDHTPSDALTYEMKLFRNNVPQTAPAHTPEPGNVSAVTEWLLTGLEPGSYTWTLNAIDAAYIASPVATGEFSIFAASAGDISGSLPDNYTLGQNYPNPFSRVTTVSYSIPGEGAVSLKVFDLRGEEVAVLASGIKRAGTYKVAFDAANLADGIYYYRLQAGDFAQARKLVISKGAGWE